MNESKSVLKRLDVQCAHKHATRCLFTEGKWWYVCPACGIKFDNQKYVERVNKYEN